MKTKEYLITLWIRDFNCTMDKLDKAVRNKIHRLYRCGTNNALSRLILDIRVEDLWRRENPDFLKKPL